MLDLQDTSCPAQPFATGEESERKEKQELLFPAHFLWYHDDEGLACNTWESQTFITEVSVG